jgi:hypothetical protein
MRAILLLQGHDRGQRTEQRVTIVGAAATVQLVALDHRLPGAEVIGPAAHFRLLVQMPIQQHGVGGFRIGACDLDEDQRRAAFQAHHFDLHATHRLRVRPGLHQLDRVLHVAVLDPVGVEHRRLVGDADVVDELADNLVVPELVDETLDLLRIH